MRRSSTRRLDLRGPRDAMSRHLLLSCLISLSVLACSTLGYDGLGGTESGAGGGGSGGNEPGIQSAPDAGEPENGGAGVGGGDPVTRVEDAGGDAGDTTHVPPPLRADGGFAAGECSGAFPDSSDAGTDAGDASTTPARIADRDCDGVRDGCIVAGDCASDALVAQYLFEGSLADATPYANDAASVGDVGYEPGTTGSGLSAIGGVLHVPRAESLEFTGDMTVELWLKPRTLPVPGARAGLLDDEGRHGLFLMGTGELRCVVGSASLSGGAVSAGAWTHVACVRDASHVTLWQDGYIRAQVPSGASMTSPGGGPLVIAGNAPNGDVFDGTIDDLRIWRQARSALDISRSAQTRQ